ncbi:MAG: phytoene desaturase family protein [Candidatus Dormiibacterota bacterium]
MRRRVAVVGAGLGGLAIAIRLLAAGFEVTVLEREPEPGGRAAQIRERGYTFDVGPSLITMPELLHDLFGIAGADLDATLPLRPLDPFYRIHWSEDPRQFSFSGDDAAMRQEIARFSAQDAARYSPFCRASGRIYEQAILGAGARPFLRLTDFLALVPRMARLDALRTVDGFVGRFFREPHVRQAFGFHPLFIGGDPFRVPAVYAALAYLQIVGGVWYADGGVHALVQALARLVERGGTLRTGARVDAVLREGDRVRGVRLAGGDEVPADAVVSNADVAETRRWAGLGGRPPRMTMSCLLLYLGTTRRFPSLAHHTLLVGPGYRRFIEDVTRRRRLPPSVSIYLHAPSRTDPSMAPPGGEALSVLLPVPNLASGLPWPATGDVLRERVLDALEGAPGLGLQELRRSIAVERRWTPLDFADRLGAHQGNAFGPEPLLRQSAYFRQPNRYRSPRGLYHVGSGTHPGAGIPGVLLTAQVTARLVAEDLRG